MRGWEGPEGGLTMVEVPKARDPPSPAGLLVTSGCSRVLLRGAVTRPAPTIIPLGRASRRLQQPTRGSRQPPRRPRGRRFAFLCGLARVGLLATLVTGRGGLLPVSPLPRGPLDRSRTARRSSRCTSSGHPHRRYPAPCPVGSTFPREIPPATVCPAATDPPSRPEARRDASATPRPRPPARPGRR
jgi:hypothetical protein